MVEIRSIRKLDGGENRYKVVYLDWSACGCSYSRHVLIMYQPTEPTEKEIHQRILNDNKV